MNRITLLSIMLALVLNLPSKAQAPTCSPTVPFFTVDLRGNPTGSWESPGHFRNSNCCGTTSPDRCTSFEIFVDTGAAMISFEIASGAIPPGSMFYQINCGPQVAVGQPICISGPGPHYLTFCKPGNNQNTYRVTSIAKPTFPPDDTTRIGCSHPIPVLGMVESSVTWNSIFPGAPGDYNSYLNCTGNCDTSIYTPALNAPPMVQYLVCGTPIATSCGYVAVCDTVTIYNQQPLTGSVSPNPGGFCSGGPGVMLTATAGGGLSPFSFVWRDQSLAQTCTGSTCLATAAGNYAVEIWDALYDSTYCPATFVSATVIVTSPPIVNAGPDQTICPNNPVVILNGSVQFATGGTWSGGAGTYSPDENSVLTGYIPTPAEIAAGQVTLTLTSTGAGGGCTDNSDDITIFFPTPLSVTVADVAAACHDGTATLNSVVAGGTLPYTYNWSNGQSSSSIISSQGTFCLTVTDNLGCMASDCGTISAPPVLALSVSSTPCSINGGNDGTATATPSGGTPPYSYSWSTGGTTASINGLSYGAYIVTVTDANGCTIISSVVVNEPRCNGFTVSGSGTNALCAGNNDGTATATVLSGTPAYTYLWSDALNQTTSTATNLSAGVYQCLVTDGIGCIQTVNVSITQPAALNNTMTHVNATAIGGNDGSATANVSGGTPGYTYTWSNGGTASTISSLTAGTYSVTITDVNSCSLVDSVQINQPPCVNLTVGVASGNVSCNGGNDGTATAIVLFATGPVSYLWSTGATTATVNGLTAGNYGVTVTDSLNCSSFVNFVITQPSPLSIALSATDIRCDYTNDGTIELTVSGGTFPYTYAWSNGLSTEDQIDLSNGTYSVIVTDAEGCSASGTATIVRPSPITITASVTPVLCNGQSNGSVDVSVSGGIAPYTYSWSSGQTTQDINSIPSGQYLLTVTDANSCVTQAYSALIDQPDTLKVSAITTDCPVPGSGLSTVTFTATGGNPGAYQYSVNGGTTFGGSGVYTMLLPVDSTYSIVVQDTFGCLSASAVALTVAPESEILTVSYPLCIADGVTSVPVTLTVTGGSGGLLSASFDNGNTWLAPGVYTDTLATGSSYAIVVRDTSGCVSVTENISISTDIALSGTLSAYNGGFNISCSGTSTGSIDLNATGGTGSYTYAWSNAATTQDLNSIPAGSYSVIVTDNGTCADTIAFTLTEPAQLTAGIASANNYNGYDISCAGGNNGGADLTVSGGVTTYSYSWSNGGTTEDISALGAGSYSVTVTDANGCTYTDNITLSEPVALAITATPQSILCNGQSTGSIDISISGGVTTYTYAWSNSAVTEDVSSLPAGSYSVTVTDINGCTVTDSYTLSEPTAVVATSTLSDFNGYEIACNGGTNGTIDLSVIGGVTPYNYAWSNAAVTEDLSAIAAGTYSVTITDANGCSQTQSYTLSEPTVLSGSIASVNDFNGYDIDCAGNTNGAVDLGVSGGVTNYSFNWSNGGTTEDISLLGAGSYNVTVTDANGCIYTNSITLSEPVALSVNSASLDILCNGQATGVIDITVAGGVSAYTFNWSNSATTEDVYSLTAGTYNVTVTDLNGCSLTNTYTVTEPSALALSSLLSDYNGYNITCYGSSDGSIDVTIGGGAPGYTYVWSNGSTSEDISGVIDGMYSVIVTDSNNCTLTQSFTLTQPAGLSGTILPVNDYNGYNLRCNGDTDGAIDLTVTGGIPSYTYTWSNGGTTEDISNLSAGTYSVNITDLNGCLFSTSLLLLEPAAIVNNAVVTDIPCNGYTTGAIDLTSTGGVFPFSYNWSNGEQSQDIDSLGAGTYTVLTTDANGCSLTSMYIINELAPVQVTSTLTGPLCYGDANASIDLTATGGTLPYTFNWSGGATSEDLTNISSGVYSVIITDLNNCSAADTFYVVNPPLLDALSVSPLTSAGYNVSNYGATDGSVDLTVQGGTAPYSYAWNTGSTTQDLSGIPAGLYTVLITDANGCQVSDSVLLTQPFELEMPTGFSPNGDGFNDYFVVHGLEVFPDNKIEIYNRWGNLVYDAYGYANQWNGTNENGDTLPDGTYFVVLSINKDAITLKGYVDIRR